MNLKTILFLFCMVCCTNAFSNSTFNKTSLKALFDNYTDVSLSAKKFEEILNFLADTIETKSANLSQKENNHEIKQKSCLSSKMNHLKTFLQIDSSVLSEMSSMFLKYLKDCLNHDNSTLNDDPSKTETIIKDKQSNWLFAFLSAIIITIIGLLCYLVVPSLNACCFNYLFQFLVALAVGSLCGDALLHLIPHAFSDHNHGAETESHDHDGPDGHDHHSDSSSHNSGVFKGLAAIVGIYVFFLIEKIMHMRRARKEKRHRQTELAISESEHELIRNAIINCTNNTTNNNSNINLNQMSKLVHEPVIESNGKVCENVLNEMRTVSPLVSSGNKVYTNEQQQQKQQVQFQNDVEDQSCLVIHANKDLKYISQYLPNNKCTENVDHHDHENEIEHLHQHSQAHRLGQLSSNNSKNKLLNEQTTLLILNGTSDANSCVCTTTQSLKLIDGDDSTTQGIDSNNQYLLNKNENLKINNISKDQSKKHGHSHSHKYKSSREKAHHDHHKKHEKEINDIKLIAWMVLMGDGLHNFSDGLAIGASFASSLTTGFGTALAVLCHELPHEIGDFAVLRRAGVSLKRALVFNLVSGILCLLGVLVGLLIGGIETLSSWAFLFIAGTFLYISLVDMIPELSEDKDDDSVINFLIQSFGILFGVGIMLAIALLEDTIIELFQQ